MSDQYKINEYTILYVLIAILSLSICLSQQNKQLGLIISNYFVALAGFLGLLTSAYYIVKFHGFTYITILIFVVFGQLAYFVWLDFKNDKYRLIEEDKRNSKRAYKMQEKAMEAVDTAYNITHNNDVKKIIDQPKAPTYPEIDFNEVNKL